jgi:hypothetical protein
MNFDEYADMMRHYLPQLPIQAIRDAYKHHATPTEVRRHLARIEGKIFKDYKS